MIHAVIDTNVLVSVLLAKSEDSSVIKLIDAVLDGKIIPLLPTEQLIQNPFQMRTTASSTKWR